MSIQIPRKRTAPPSRRTFRNPSDELGYCCEKATHFLVEGGSRPRAGRYVARIHVLLRLIRSPASIGVATAKALAAEFDRDWTRGGAWRRREAARVGRFHRTLRNRAQLANLAASWPWLALETVTRQFRLVLRMYEEAASPREVARVRKAIQAIRWVEV